MGRPGAPVASVWGPQTPAKRQGGVRVSSPGTHSPPHPGVQGRAGWGLALDGCWSNHVGPCRKGGGPPSPPAFGRELSGSFLGLPAGGGRVPPRLRWGKPQEGRGGGPPGKGQRPGLTQRVGPELEPSAGSRGGLGVARPRPGCSRGSREDRMHCCLLPVRKSSPQSTAPILPAGSLVGGHILQPCTPSPSPLANGPPTLMHTAEPQPPRPSSGDLPGNLGPHQPGHPATALNPTPQW